MLQVCNAPAVWLLKTILTLDIRGGVDLGGDVRGTQVSGLNVFYTATATLSQATHKIYFLNFPHYL